VNNDEVTTHELDIQLKLIVLVFRLIYTVGNNKGLRITKIILHMYTTARENDSGERFSLIFR
jgi:hypothetical protein